jgi:hypothetical protein
VRFSAANLFLIRVTAIIFVALPLRAAPQTAPQTQPPTSAGSVAKPFGTVKAISGNSITLATDSGNTVSVVIQDSTRMVRTLPGQKDLQGATPVQLNELKVGDRMLVRGKLWDDGKSVQAASVIIMTGADIAAKQQQQRDDWRRRGTGGLVKEVDAANGTITITVSGTGGTKTTVVRVSKDTIIRRYAPDSVKFDDAKPGTIDQIKPGDQLRARGARSDDGSELSAEEIVSGKFRNVAGTVVATDAASNSVTVQDLLTKSQVTLKIAIDSQLHNVPAMMAQRIAMRLKGGAGQDASNGATAGQTAAPGAGQSAAGGAGNGTGGARAGGGADFQQMLDRMPAVTLSDLQKGSVVMAVATEGSASTQPTAITLLTGVEPILTASPDNKGAAMLLSPWNLGGGADAAGANQ